MDILSVLRTFGALAIVLGLLGGALWAVRRYDIRLPSRFMAGPQERRLALIERLALDGRRSVALIRAGEREHVVLIAPEGLLVLDGTAASTTTRPRSLVDA